MSDAEYVARIRAYLEQHRATYDREALRQKLLADGHPPQAIELAMAQVYGFQVQNTAPTVQRDPALPLILTLIGIFLLNYVLIGLVVGLEINRGGDGGILWLLLLLIPIEVGAAIVVRRRNRPVGRGIIWGLVASLVPILGAVLLFGICLALIYSA